MGRLPTRPITLRNGFYIEVKIKGAKNGFKIRSESRAEMMKSVDTYKKIKDVTILGELKKGKWIDNPSLNK